MLVICEPASKGESSQVAIVGEASPDTFSDPTKQRSSNHLQTALAAKSAGFDLKHCISLLLKGIDECDRQCYEKLLNWSYKVQYTAEEIQSLAEQQDRSTIFWVGYLRMTGKGGFERDAEAAFQAFSRAASMGHAYAWERKASCYRYGEGVAQDDAAALYCNQHAADLGCACACGFAADMLTASSEDADDTTLFRAASMYQKGAALGHNRCEMFLQSLIKFHPWRIVPWGLWQPQPTLQRLVPAPVKEAMREWMMVARRKRVDRYVALEVAALIVTKSGWERFFE